VNAEADESSGSWGNKAIVAGMAVFGILAPILLILALALSWGAAASITFGVLTVAIWAGVPLAFNIAAGRVERRDSAREPAEIAQLPALAARRGLSYMESNPDLADTLDRFCRSHGQASHVLSGHLGDHPVALCWYERTKAGTQLRSLALLIALPASMPPLEIQPTLARELAPGLRREMVHFEDEKFNDCYVVIPTDHSPQAHRYAVDMISQRAIDALLSVKPFFFDIDHEVIRVDGSAVLAADEVEQLLDTAVALTRMIDAVPEFAWKQYGSPAAPLPGLTPHQPIG
jgi:hypothetical protein